MNLGIRELNESDYEDVLVRWWKDWGWKEAPQKKFLPDNGKGGLMVTLEDKPVCAGFIYFASNADVAWVEWIVSDRNIKENRDEALNYLLETLIGYVFILLPLVRTEQYNCPIRMLLGID